MLTSPDIPFNEGSKRPVDIVASYGSLLNPRPPAPVRARMLSAYRAYNAVMKALARAVPEKVMAAGFDTTHSTCLSHLDEQGYSIYLEIFGGGYGASAVGDGCDAVDSPLSNCSNIPIEAIDMEHGFFRVVEYALVQGSGGGGEYRGGLGMRRVYEVLADGVEYQSYSDRFTIPPEGLFGGRGRRRRVHLRAARQREDHARLEDELRAGEGRSAGDEHRRRCGLRSSAEPNAGTPRRGRRQRRRLDGIAPLAGARSSIPDPAAAFRTPPRTSPARECASSAGLLVSPPFSRDRAVAPIPTRKRDRAAPYETRHTPDPALRTTTSGTTPSSRFDT